MQPSGGDTAHATRAETEQLPLQAQACGHSDNQPNIEEYGLEVGAAARGRTRPPAGSVASEVRQQPANSSTDGEKAVTEAEQRAALEEANMEILNRCFVCKGEMDVPRVSVCLRKLKVFAPDEFDTDQWIYARRVPGPDDRPEDRHLEWQLFSFHQEKDAPEFVVNDLGPVAAYGDRPTWLVTLVQRNLLPDNEEGDAEP